MFKFICPKCGVVFEELDSEMDFCPICSPMLDISKQGNGFYCFRCGGIFKKDEIISSKNDHYCPTCVTKLQLIKIVENNMIDCFVETEYGISAEFCDSCPRLECCNGHLEKEVFDYLMHKFGRYLYTA